MKQNNSTLLSFILTLVLLTLSEVITTTVLPLMGLPSLRFSLFPLLILFLSFYRNSNWIAFYILAYSYIHSIFSLETWFLSAFNGVLVSIIIAYFSELIHLSNKLVTMFFVLIFQIGMALSRSIVFYLRGDDPEYIFQNLSGHVFEIFALTALSPIVFSILSTLWARKTDSIEEIA